MPEIFSGELVNSLTVTMLMYTGNFLWGVSMPEIFSGQLVNSRAVTMLMYTGNFLWGVSMPEIFSGELVNSRAVTVLRYTRCNIVILMAATAWLMLSFSSCILCGFDSYTVLFKCPQREVRYTNQMRARYMN